MKADKRNPLQQIRSNIGSNLLYLCIFVITSTLLGQALFAGPLLPWRDLPDHLALISLLDHARVAGSVAADHYQLQWMPVPYWLFYGSVWLLACLMSWTQATQVVALLGMLATPLALGHLLKTVGRDPRWGLLVMPLFFNHNLMYGWVSYCLGIPVLFVTIAETIRRLEHQTGWIKLAMERLPMPIVMGMVAGVFVEFGLDWIRAFETDFFLVAAMTAVFFALAAIPNAQQFMPPMIGVLVIGILVLFLQDSAVTTQPYDGPVLAAPRLFLPEFSLAATLELVLPLTITVIATQNAQGIIILRSAGHSPPVNSLTAMCGAGSLVAALFGCVSTCLTGPSNALLVSSGAKERQWIGGVILGVIAILFGAFAPAVTNLLIATPTAFLSTLAGLALLRTLQSAFKISFGEGFTSGALVAFLVTFAGLPILNIGSPFWGLVFGVITSLLIERQSFLKL